MTEQRKNFVLRLELLDADDMDSILTHEVPFSALTSIAGHVFGRMQMIADFFRDVMRYPR